MPKQKATTANGRNAISSSALHSILTPEERDKYVEGLVSEIARDIWTLNHCPDVYPGPEFFQQRIQDNQDEIERVRGMA